MTLTTVSPARPRNIISSPVLGTTIFVFCEVMFFSGLISAFLIIKASNKFWAIPPGVTLPILATGFNTLLLFASGTLLHFSGRTKDPGKRTKLVLYSALTGAGFVAFQGYEWLGLLDAGLSLFTGIYGALFFLIVGTHALHALSGALLLLFYCSKKQLPDNTIQALKIFWFLIVGIWPVIYYVVYFN